jgi:hypothetical protein
METYNFTRQIVKQANGENPFVNAQKFMLPYNGYLDNLRAPTAIYDQELHLPFPEICLEYFLEVADQYGNRENSAVMQYCSERVWPEINKKYIHIASYMRKLSGEWYSLPAIGIAANKGWYVPEVDGKFGVVTKPDPKWTQISIQLNIDPTENIIQMTMPLISLLNVLGCSNVSIRKEAPRKNNKKNPLPFDAYWVLELNSRTYSDGISRPHGSPREHVRRGHSRRQHYKDGIKNIWIQPTIVNPGAPGKICKDYAVS